MTAMAKHHSAGNMKDEVGTWLLQPSADARSTTIEYRAQVQSGFFVPHVVVPHALKGRLPAALVVLRERAEHPAQLRLASPSSDTAQPYEQPCIAAP
jgi:hypothetical protein